MAQSEEMRIYSLLSIAQKAGRLKSGETAVEKSVQGLKSHLVIVAADASENTKKQFRDKCAFYEVPCTTFGTKDGIGQAIGKAERSSVSIEDEGLATTLVSKIDGGKTNGEN